MTSLRWLAALLPVLLLPVIACGSSQAPAAPPPATRPAIVSPTATAGVEAATPAAPTTAPTITPRATAPPEPSSTPVPPAPVAPPAATQASAPRVTPTTPPAPERPPPITIQSFLSLADRSFEPHQIHGNAGDTVVVTLSGGTEQHTFTIDSLGVDVVIPAGQSREVTFVVPAEGETPFYCRFHGSPTAGMHGLLIFH